MKKIFGGLLMTVLLTNPFSLKFDFLAYKVYLAQERIIAIVRKAEEEEEKEISMDDIEEIFTNIDHNTRSIKSLLKDKNTIFGKIQSIMSLKAYTKTIMADYQITAFQDFNKFYWAESQNVNETLELIENKNLEDVKKEIFKPESDFEYVYNELKIITDHQCDAIYNLNSIIEKSTNTLAVLC